MMRKILLFAPILLFAACADQPDPLAPETNAQFARHAPPGRGGALGAVYVTSQGLYYDTFVAAEVLPNKGPFQKLDSGMTEWGPGQPGYLGGRWWEDTNHNDIRDDTDTYLLCPLLGPGRETP